MDEQTKQLIDALKLWGANDVKKMQTKLTKTANSITKDGLHYKLTPLLSDEEQATLRRAAAILKSVKSKVEHAKEVKAREEKKDQEIRDKCCRAQRKAINECFPKPETLDEHRTVLLWVLAGISYKREVFGLGGYFLDINYLWEDINRWSEKERSFTISETLEHSGNRWRNDFVEQLERDLFRSDEMPDTEKLNDIKVRIETTWKSDLESKYAAIFEAFDNEVLAIESDNVVRVRTKGKS